jgi:hypothetical protein
VRHVVFICTGMLIAAVAAALIVRAATGDPHVRDVATVALLTTISAHLSLVPLMLCRRSTSPVVIFQAGFGGTVLHLLLTVALGAGVYALNVVQDRGPFVLLLMGLYWVSLMLVVVAMIRVFRRAVSGASPPAGVPSTGAPATPTTR